MLGYVYKLHIFISLVCLNLFLINSILLKIKADNPDKPTFDPRDEVDEMLDNLGNEKNKQFFINLVSFCEGKSTHVFIFTAFVCILPIVNIAMIYLTALNILKCLNMRD